MSNTRDPGTDWNRDAMERGRPQHTNNPTRQLDDGTYRVLLQEDGPDDRIASRQQVGMVYVEAGETSSVEHYVLTDAHRSPTLELHMGIAKSDRSYATRREFFAAMREEHAGRKVTYIEARCTYRDEIPEA